jgi:predicted Zn-dependent peptidase
LTYQRTDLDCGVRVLTERMPGLRAASVGAWVGAGSRDEAPEVAGATHFLEHLLFKGTPTRSAVRIAELFDEVGGEVNAFTTKEFTCFYARILDTDVPMALDVIVDMLQNSILAPDEVEAERKVVLEEIGMHEDQPDDIVHDLFHEAVWGDHPLGRRIQGYTETVAGMERDAIEQFWRSHYTPGNVVVAAAGAVDHAAVVDAVSRAYAGAPPGEFHAARATDGGPPAIAKVTVNTRKLEQSHLVYGTLGLPRNSPDRWALGVLNIALGAGMSSRLFQEIREKRGLAYSVYSMHSGFADTGLMAIYAATAPKQVHDVLELIRKEIDGVIEGGLSDEEMARAKGHLKGSLVLGLEESGGRMSRLGKGELCHGEILEPDDIISRIEAVTPDDVRGIAKRVLGDGVWALAVLGANENGFDQFVRRD